MEYSLRDSYCILWTFLSNENKNTWSLIKTFCSKTFGNITLLIKTQYLSNKRLDFYKQKLYNNYTFPKNKDKF